MSNEAGNIWIVFNGEIYNFQELRDELVTHGHDFRTKSDTEVIIHAYEEWGTEAFPKLNGMYGLAIWDSQKRELLLARDPFGIKPLYYADYQGRLAFGSEIKAVLVDTSFPRIVNLTALDDFLTFTFVPSPQTLFCAIHKLPPGHFLRVTCGGITLARFYQRPIDLQLKSEDQWSEALVSELKAAVRRQMIADVPVGIMLSGGIDSATVATLMSHYAEQPVHSFTVGFSGDFKHNELSAARRSAEIIGTTHHEAVISAAEYARFLPESLYYLEEPVATASTLAFYWICKLARETVKVVLTGQGADEPFAGYPRHLGEYYGNLYRHIPLWIRKHVLTTLVDHLPRNEQLKRAVHSLGNDHPLERLTQVYSIFSPQLKSKLYRFEVNNQVYRPPHEAVKLWQGDVKHLDGLSQMLYVDARFSLPDNLLMYGDKMSMAASLEARVPFLDLEVMKLVESIPPQFKIRKFKQKYLLKRVVKSWLSPEIMQRKKIGFATPIDQWFSHDLRSYINDQLLSSGSACNYFFEPTTIRSLIEDHESGRHDYKRPLFSLLTFELWYQQFITHKTPMEVNQ
jgi:asparagine synthase (glutamine-hydrolysing)